MRNNSVPAQNSLALATRSFEPARTLLRDRSSLGSSRPGHLMELRSFHRSGSNCWFQPGDSQSRQPQRRRPERVLCEFALEIPSSEPIQLHFHVEMASLMRDGQVLFSVGRHGLVALFVDSQEPHKTVCHGQFEYVAGQSGRMCRMGLFRRTSPREMKAPSVLGGRVRISGLGKTGNTRSTERYGLNPDCGYVWCFAAGRAMTGQT